MKNKYSKISLIVIVIIFAYLYLAHAYIYQRLARISLSATDNRHTYIINNNMTDSKKIIYASLGDSLTAGVGTDKYEESYPYLLAQSFGENNQIIVHQNFSYPGARTADLIKDLLEPAIAAQPDLITLLIGVNDMHGFVDNEQFKKNYDYILQELTKKTKAKIYIISLPNIGSHSLILPPYNYYFESKIGEFNLIIKDLAKNYNLKYVDLTTPTTAILQQDGPHYSADLFHPSALGYKSWSKIIYDNINQ